MVKTLLQQGPSLVNARDANGWMPLHHAARHGHALIVDLAPCLRQYLTRLGQKNLHADLLQHAQRLAVDGFDVIVR